MRRQTRWRGAATPSRERPADALVYTCKHLNLDLDEATCAVLRLEDGLSRCLDPLGHFIDPIQSRN
jgi:hypothetical protein